MNLEMPEKEKISKKRITIYAAVIGICVFSIIIVVGVQILGNDVIDNLFGINKLVKRTEQEEASLKANFERTVLAVLLNPNQRDSAKPKKISRKSGELFPNWSKN